jgi:DNA-binding CsgD family transcriptional regulator
MDAVAQATGSFGAILLPVPPKPIPVVPTSESLGSASVVYFRDGWVDHDERYRGIPRLLKYGVTSDFDFATADHIKRSPYYQDFLGRAGLRWFAGIKVTSGEDTWCLSIQRSINQGPFSTQELRKLVRLCKPLSSAASTARALGYARAEGALEAFALTDHPAFMLGQAGEVLQANTAAERVLREHDDLSIRDGLITSFSADATASLYRALYAVMSSDSSLMAPIPLPRRKYRRPLLAYAIRLSTVSHDTFAACRAILVLVDLDAQPSPPVSVLRDCFGLSAAEARLAKGLAAGYGLDQCAEELSITKNTARQELKSVFGKLEVRRQSELVTLLSKILHENSP